MVNEKKTSCLFCSIGCGVKIKPGEDTVLFGPQSIDELEFDYDNPVNLGSLCGRGVSLIELIGHPERLFSPMMRKNSGMERIDWNDAFEHSAEKFLNVIKNNGPDSVGIILGTTATIEEAKVAKDFADFLDIRNIDFLAPEDKPILHAVQDFPYPLKKATKIQDLENANLSFVIGDLFFGYPVTSRRILKAKYDRRGNKVITIDSNYTNTTWFGNTKLINKPGTEAVTLLGIIKKVLDSKSKLNDDEKEIKKYVNDYSYENIEKITGISSSTFSESANSLLSNGNKYIYLASNYGIFAKSNIVGYLAQVLSFITDSPFIPLYTGGNSVGLYKTLYNDGKGVNGLSASQMIKAAAEGDIKSILIFGTDPISSLPSNLGEKAFDKMDFILSVNIFPTEMTKKADIEMPAASFFEKEGTAINFFNMDVSLSPIIEPFGQSKSALNVTQSFKDYVIRNRWKVSVKDEKEGKQEDRKYDYWAKLKEFFDEKLSEDNKDYNLITHFHPGSVADGSISKYFWWAKRDLPEPYVFIHEDDPNANFRQLRISGKNGDLVLPIKKKQNILPNVISVPVHFKEIRNFFSWEIEEKTNYVSLKPEIVKIKGIE